TRARDASGSRGGGSATARQPRADDSRHRQGATRRPLGGDCRPSRGARERSGRRAAPGDSKSADAAGPGAIDTIRSFVAILLEDALRAELAEAIERLRPVARDVAWVNPGNIHLTVKFLGNVAQDRSDAIVAALTSAVGALAAFDATIHGVRAFPSLT